MQMMRPGPHIGENQRPEMHNRQAIRIHRAFGLLRDKVVHHTQIPRREDKADRVMPVPPLNHGILHTRIGGVGFGERNGHTCAVDQMQDRDRNDIRTEKPVCHVDMRHFAFDQGAEKHHGIRDPDDGDEDANRPFEFSIFLAARKTHRQRNGGQHQHGLPTPEGESGQLVGKQAHLTSSLHHIIRSGE